MQDAPIPQKNPAMVLSPSSRLTLPATRPLLLLLLLAAPTMLPWTRALATSLVELGMPPLAAISALATLAAAFGKAMQVAAAWLSKKVIAVRYLLRLKQN